METRDKKFLKNRVENALIKYKNKIHDNFYLVQDVQEIIEDIVNCFQFNRILYDFKETLIITLDSNSLDCQVDIDETYDDKFILLFYADDVLIKKVERLYLA